MMISTYPCSHMHCRDCFNLLCAPGLPCCMQWMKFAEMSYVRSSSSSSSSSSKSKESWQEQTVVFCVDAWSVARPNVAGLEAVSKAQAGQAEEEAARKLVEEAEDALKKAEAVGVHVLPGPVMWGCAVYQVSVICIWISCCIWCVDHPGAMTVIAGTGA